MADLMNRLSINDTLSTAWEKVSGAKATLWAAFGIIFATGIASAILQALFNSYSHALGVTVGFAINLLMALLSAGIWYIGIMRAKNQPISFDLMFNAFKQPIWLSLAGFYILYFIGALVYGFIGGLLFGIFYSLLATASQTLAIGLGIFLGIFLFGLLVFFIIRIIFAIAFIIDQEVSLLEGLRLSWKSTQSNVLNIIATTLICMLFVIISVLPLGIGLIWSLPFYQIAMGEIYKFLADSLKNANN